MNTTKIISVNSKKIRVIPEAAGLYPADDLPPYIEKLMERMAKKSRLARDDLVKGNVVIVLEGDYTGKRVVFLKQLDNNQALCCGPSQINSVPFFTIDEKYLLKTSVVLDFDGNVDIEMDGILESKRGVVVEKSDRTSTRNEKKIEDAITKKAASIKFMKKYLSTPFKMPSFKNISELRF